MSWSDKTLRYHCLPPGVPTCHDGIGEKAGCVGVRWQCVPLQMANAHWEASDSRGTVHVVEIAKPRGRAQLGGVVERVCHAGHGERVICMPVLIMCPCQHFRLGEPLFLRGDAPTCNLLIGAILEQMAFPPATKAFHRAFEQRVRWPWVGPRPRAIQSAAEACGDETPKPRTIWWR